MRNYRLLMLSIVVVATLGAPAGPLAANETPVSRQAIPIEKNKLATVREKITRTDSELGHSQRQLDAESQRLEVVETKLAELNKAIVANQTAREATQHALSTLKQERVTLDATLANLRQQLGEQLQAAYRQGGQGKVKILLGIDTIETMSRFMTYYDYLHQANIEVIEQTKETLQLLDKNQAKINRQQQKLKHTNQALLTQRQSAAANRVARQKAMATINQSLTNKRLLLKKLRDDAHKLEQLIEQQRAQKPRFALTQPNTTAAHTFSQLKGKLTWPVKGKVIHHFGESIQRHLQWNGLVIASASGDKVYAPTGGRVVFADWMRGFGLLLIVDHGDGFLSLYGRNQVLYKQPGDAVTPGDVLGLVGASGGFSETGLYFEIRQQGKPVDPEVWLTKITT